MTNRFLFIGGDKRIKYSAEKISENFEVSEIGLNGEFSKPMGIYGNIVLPLPFSRDGMNINAPLSEQKLPLSIIPIYAAHNADVFSGGTSPELIKLCSEAGLRLHDYFNREDLTLKNAFFTAEGAISLLISNMPVSLNDSNAIILGAGRIAKYTARLLKAFGANTIICARNPIQRKKASLEGYKTVDFGELSEYLSCADFVINTVPAHTLNGGDFELLKSGSVFLELATKSEEPEKTLSEKNGVTFLYATGLPGKFSPKSAGICIAETILTIRKELND